jgi:murein DD-endopeptidase MepM/ murein hydrolase activator NlpD
LKHQHWLILILCIILAACAPQEAAPTPAPTLPATATQPPATETPQPTAIPAPTETETTLPTPIPLQVCSPLKGFAIADLSSIISNPYAEPFPGFDDGHHGVDYAFYSYPALGLTQMKGLPIQAALAGKVITSSRNLDPYGYTVIIETPLDALPADLLTELQLPQPAPFPTQVAPIICPDLPVPTEWESAPASLYLLYAHMDQPPAVQAEQTVACRQTLGVVGTTGLSVNEHLHFEVRVGPSGAVFENLGHYTTSASETERHNYCTWRISGWFQLVDPTLLLHE